MKRHAPRRTALGVPVPRGRDAEGVGLGDRLAQQVDQRVVDARVLDAGGSEEKSHCDRPSRIRPSSSSPSTPLRTHRARSSLPASFRSRAGRIRTCIAAGPGRCASTPASARRQETNERFRYLLERGPDRALRRLRPADAARLRLRRPARRRARSGAPGVAIDSLDGHADAARRDPARRGLDLDDDQRAGGAAPAALRTGRRGAGRVGRRASAARSRTTSSRSTSRAGPTSSRRARRCA